MRVNKFVVKIAAWTLVGVSVIVGVRWQSRGATASAVLDIGQGDSILITTPNRTHILIDGGPDDAVLSEMATEMLFGEEIDVLIVTHTDADHISGGFPVSVYYDVGKTYVDLSIGESKLIDWWEWEANPLYAGDVLCFDENEVCLEVLWPTEEYLKTNPGPNDASVVAKLTYGDFCMLLTGDIEKGVEKQLVTMYGDRLRCDVLKVPHHGSSSSSTDGFLDAVSPKLAIISVGEANRYGHPTKEVLNRYSERGIQVLRTDQLGTVRVKSDGSVIKW